MATAAGPRPAHGHGWQVKRPADATPLEKPAPVEEEDDVWDLDDGDEEDEDEEVLDLDAEGEL